MLNRTHLRALVLSTALAIGGAFAAQAATMPNTVTITDTTTSQALQARLTALGFTEVQPVARSGNVFTTRAQWEGRWVDLAIDAKSGGIVDHSAGASSIGKVDTLSDAELRAALGHLGYSDIGAIEREGNVVSTTAVRDGRPVALSIDARTGGVRQDGGDAAIGLPKSGLTAAELQQQLAPLGFTSVSDVVEEGDVYSLNAVKDGRRVALRIDSKSGAVRVVR